MGILPSTNPPRSRHSPAFIRRFGVGLLRYGPAFAAQVFGFFFILSVAQIITTGRLGTPIQLDTGLIIVTLGLGVAEAHHKLYRRVWAVAGVADAVALALAVVEATCLITLANVLLPVGLRPYPSVIPVLLSPIALSVIGTFRFLPRLLSRRPVAENRLLVVIQDQSAYNTVKALIQSPSALWSMVAIVTVRSLETHQTLMGIPIVGDTRDLEHWIKVTNADGVGFVVSDTGNTHFREMVGTCLRLEKPIFMIPHSDELFRSPGMSRLRQLSADDLLSRPVQELKLESAQDAIRDKTVLVTGAAGSVGSELCRTLARLNPGRLVLVDNNESGLFDIAAQLRSIASVDVREALVSIVDRDRLLTVFTEERPDITFHAAAYKHVPMLESHPEEAYFVNVRGTMNTIWCAEAVSVTDFVLISTDKAASAESVMGCTKRLCELLVLSHGGTMHCRAVRFGNVVGSRGSVIPTFERQIQQGGPVTITHPDMTRYMMTSRQAAGLVIGTILLPPGHLYMLDMGEPIKIRDIANALIRARGLRPGKDIDVVYSGIRDGERLSENLIGPNEGWRPSPHPSIRQVLTPMPADPRDLEWTIDRLNDLATEQKSTELMRALRKAVWTGPASRGEIEVVEDTSKSPVD